MTSAREAASTWRGTWAVRLLGLVVFAAIVLALVALVYHLKIVGG